MADETTFASTDQERVPAAYFVPADLKVAVERLRAHGIALVPDRRRGDAAARGVHHRDIDGDAQAVREPPGAHRHRRPGRRSSATVAAGAWRVPMTQRLARLAFYLLEPRSNDGLATWNVLDEALKSGRSPILRTRN